MKGSGPGRGVRATSKLTHDTKMTLSTTNNQFVPPPLPPEVFNGLNDEQVNLTRTTQEQLWRLETTVTVARMQILQRLRDAVPEGTWTKFIHSDALPIEASTIKRLVAMSDWAAQNELQDEHLVALSPRAGAIIAKCDLDTQIEMAEKLRSGERVTIAMAEAARGDKPVKSKTPRKERVDAELLDQALEANDQLRERLAQLEDEVNYYRKKRLETMENERRMERLEDENFDIWYPAVERIVAQHGKDADQTADRMELDYFDRLRMTPEQKIKFLVRMISALGIDLRTKAGRALKQHLMELAPVDGLELPEADLSLPAPRLGQVEEVEG